MPMKSTIMSLVKLSAPFLALSLSSAAFADVPSYVRIRNISYAGSGCPAGTVAENVSSDLKAFTLLFDSYIAEIGPGISARENRKNCQVLVDLDFPGGWSYSIVDVDYRGYVSAERGVTATQASAYYFQGQGATGRLTTDMRGPIDRDYQIRDTLGLNALVWSPCGAQRALNINSQVRLSSTNRRASGLITLDSIDGQVSHIYGLQWQRCR
jgi:hypothetical protein